MQQRRKIASTVIQTGDRLQSEQQARTQAVTGAVNGLPMTRGRAIKRIALPSGAKLISHGLGKVPEGWIVTRMTDNASAVVETQTLLNPDPKNYIELSALVACVVDLWIY